MISHLHINFMTSFGTKLYANEATGCPLFWLIFALWVINSLWNEIADIQEMPPPATDIEC